MSIESFYLQIFTDSGTKNRIITMIEENQSFKECLDYSKFESENLISGTFVSFLTTNEIIYFICKQLKDNCNCRIILNSLKENHEFDFDKFIDFFIWIYQIWSCKLYSFNRDYGAFIMNPKLYYKTQRKLKKFYKKIDFKR